MSLGVSVSSRPKAVLGSISSDYLLTVCHQIIFLATGIFTTICNQHIFYQGGAEPSTMLLSFPTYAGMFLVVLLPISRKPAYISQRRVFFSAVFDVGSNVLCMLGLQIVGSGVFQVRQRIYEGNILKLLLLGAICLGCLLQRHSLSLFPRQATRVDPMARPVQYCLWFGCDFTRFYDGACIYHHIGS